MWKIINCIFDYILPKSESQKLFDEIKLLDDKPQNYGKISMIYLKLQNGFGACLGKTDDDNYFLFMTIICGEKYKLYRNLFNEYKNKNNY